jgi:hypothetical protein
VFLLSSAVVMTLELPADIGNKQLVADEEESITGCMCSHHNLESRQNRVMIKYSDAAAGDAGSMFHLTACLPFGSIGNTRHLLYSLITW